VKVKGGNVGLAQPGDREHAMPTLEHQFKDIQKSEDLEIIIGLVGAVGTDLDEVVRTLKDRLQLKFNYASEIISISQTILCKVFNVPSIDDEFVRINKYMDLGNELRRTVHNGILAEGVAAVINAKRTNRTIFKRKAFIVKSLKNEAEVKLLREIYRNGFYLISVYADKAERCSNLSRKISNSTDIDKLIERDESEQAEFGQQTRDIFQMADFFIDYSSDQPKMRANINRILDLIFGYPYHTPTFGEYAMFMAFCASLRSGDLSRQVGAAICLNDEVIATGVNDCAKFCGGLYWQQYGLKPGTVDKYKYYDDKDGKDFMRGMDSNKAEIGKLAKEIVTALGVDDTKTQDMIDFLMYKTKLGDLTEFNRAVHAEMEALAMCARNNISCRGADMYVTTFPCHNCAKHLVAAGISKVIYIEPYIKSKAIELFGDTIVEKAYTKEKSDKVMFIPFFGVGPRKFIEMFSMNLLPLSKRVRKNKAGQTIKFNYKEASVRDPMLPLSYIDNENYAALNFYKTTPMDERFN